MGERDEKIELIAEIRGLHPHDFAWNVSHFDRLAGTDRLRIAIERDELPQLLRDWEAEAIGRAPEPYLLHR